MSKPYPNRAVQRIEQFRSDNQWTLRQLAKELATPLPTVSGWVHHGKMARGKSIAQLRERGICTADDFILPPTNENAGTAGAAKARP